MDIEGSWMSLSSLAEYNNKNRDHNNSNNIRTPVDEHLQVFMLQFNGDCQQRSATCRALHSIGHSHHNNNSKCAVIDKLSAVGQRRCAHSLQLNGNKLPKSRKDLSHTKERGERQLAAERVVSWGLRVVSRVQPVAKSQRSWMAAEVIGPSSCCAWTWRSCLCGRITFPLELKVFLTFRICTLLCFDLCK